MNKFNKQFIYPLLRTILCNDEVGLCKNVVMIFQSSPITKVFNVELFGRLSGESIRLIICHLNATIRYVRYCSVAEDPPIQFGLCNDEMKSLHSIVVL